MTESEELEAQKAWVRLMPTHCPTCGAKRFCCRPDCPTRSGIDQARADDASWFRAHPGAQERVRPFTTAEHVGWLLATGMVRSDLACISRSGVWFTENGRPTEEILWTSEVP
ncbi:hypothetical protein GCM10028802_11660 [Terrabacter terrigena]